MKQEVKRLDKQGAFPMALCIFKKDSKTATVNHFQINYIKNPHRADGMVHQVRTLSPSVWKPNSVPRTSIIGENQLLQIIL